MEIVAKTDQDYEEVQNRIKLAKANVAAWQAEITHLERVGPPSGGVVIDVAPPKRREPRKTRLGTNRRTRKRATIDECRDAIYAAMGDRQYITWPECKNITELKDRQAYIMQTLCRRGDLVRTVDPNGGLNRYSKP